MFVEIHIEDVDGDRRVYEFYPNADWQPEEAAAYIVGLRGYDYNYDDFNIVKIVCDGRPVRLPEYYDY